MLQRHIQKTKRTYGDKNYSYDCVNFSTNIPDCDISAVCAVDSDFVISSDKQKQFYHVQPAYDGVGVIGNISPLFLYPDTMKSCKDISYGNGHFLVAFSTENEFGIWITQPDGSFQKTI